MSCIIFTIVRKVLDLLIYFFIKNDVFLVDNLLDYYFIDCFSLVFLQKIFLLKNSSYYSLELKSHMFAL